MFILGSVRIFRPVEVECVEGRSHDSRTYGTRFMRRLDDPSRIARQKRVRRSGVSKADILRQLIMEARTEGFPPHWQMRAHACGTRRHGRKVHTPIRSPGHDTRGGLTACLRLVSPLAYPRADHSNRVGTYWRTIGPPDAPIRSQAVCPQLPRTPALCLRRLGRSSRTGNRDLRHWPPLRVLHADEPASVRVTPDTHGSGVHTCVHHIPTSRLGVTFSLA
jgi:hypothetical protein